MGITTETHFELALYPYGVKERRPDECLPERLECKKEYSFLHREQGIYFLMLEVPLITRNNGGGLSRPIASVKIREATHFVSDEINSREIWTRGIYEIIEVYDPVNKEIHFEGMQKAKKKGE